MLKEFELKNYLSFQEANLKFNNGLIVFSGASGAGKSILLNAILESFGIEQTEASSISATLHTSMVNHELLSLNYGLECDSDEEIFIKKIQKGNNRFYLNNQKIKKQAIQEIFQDKVKYLKTKNGSDFSNSNLLNLLDNIVFKKNKSHQKNIDKYNSLLIQYKKIASQLAKLDEETSAIEQIIEYTEFELSKLNSVELDEDYYEEIKTQRDIMSNIDTFNELRHNINDIPNKSYEVIKFLNAMNEKEENIALVEEAFNLIEHNMTKVDEEISKIEEYDIEKILDEISAFSSLVKKYGSIQEAILEKEQKEQKIRDLANIDINKENLQIELDKLKREINDIMECISSTRKKFIPDFQKKLLFYANKMYIENIAIVVEDIEKDIQNLDSNIAKDNISITINNNTSIDKISTGELNRLRLSIMSVNVEYLNIEGGILFLDEIDSNLSGEESMSVAEVLLFLSKKYQIFSISHLPQLTAKAHQHFLISKDKDVSSVKELSQTEREIEIARLISGKELSNEAIGFAKKMLS